MEIDVEEDEREIMLQRQESIAKLSQICFHCDLDMSSPCKDALSTNEYPFMYSETIPIPSRLQKLLQTIRSKRICPGSVNLTLNLIVPFWLVGMLILLLR